MFPNANAFLTGGRLVEEWSLPWYQIDCNQEKKWQNFEKSFDKCFPKGCHYEKKEEAASILAGGGGGGGMHPASTPYTPHHHHHHHQKIIITASIPLFYNL